MPLLSGKGNIGKNITTEKKSGKSGKVSLAIALSKAFGKKESKSEEKKDKGMKESPKESSEGKGKLVALLSKKK